MEWKWLPGHEVLKLDVTCSLMVLSTSGYVQSDEDVCLGGRRCTQWLPHWVLCLTWVTSRVSVDLLHRLSKPAQGQFSCSP